ncbi:MAG: AAA family ATPase [Chlorobi bacterium]|nr:AAA family ATPase [Chlorobiota bacterium]
MINEIHIEKVTSYKNPAKFLPTKKISLVYGLNGSGKSTISDFLYNPDDPEFSDCKYNDNSESEILVYNQLFLKDYFYEEDNLKGVFTLSKENKDVLVSIEQETKKMDPLKATKTSLEEKISELDKQIAAAKQNAVEQVWEIKTKYTGGDRVLEYCLDGLKRTEPLFNHISSIDLPSVEPEDTIEGLKTELASLQGDKAIPINRIDDFSFSGVSVEENDLFQKIIVGSQEGSVAEFITTLGNSDWVKTGLSYIPKSLDSSGSACPFCQEDTITEDLLESIKGVFDVSYDRDIEQLKKNKDEYFALESLLNIKDIKDIVVVSSDLSQRWKSNVEEINANYRENKLLIESKLNNPSSTVALKSNRNVVDKFNGLIGEVNELIDIHNSRLDNKQASLAEIKIRFWALMRWYYEQTLAAFMKADERLKKTKNERSNELKSNASKIRLLSESIVELRKKTVNIEEAIININNGLSEIGITDISIIKHSNNLYRISRTDTNINAFHTLSEGEKTVISFLYFIELCKGQLSATSSPKNKIVVIDDPISSLSHIYVFNICQLIKRIFFNSPDFEQVIVLTHSLYLFYELTHTNKEKRNELQELYRIIKNSSGSNIIDMKYEEIQNDYQSYWAIIKDDLSPPALIANCMRNIIEYFFNFVQKKDFGNVFQKPALSGDKYQTFYRYMNRESHSLGQNIFDIKEFDHAVFKEGLKLIFEECGYSDHYKAMMK